MGFDIHRVYGCIFKVWRARRQALFESVVRPRPGDALLDVGGYPGTWTGRPQQVGRIDCLNIEAIRWKPEDAPGHSIRTLVGDGCALPFADGSYDIAYSNSVIEHVGDWERQKAFASEIRRVGRRLWVQTPACECPIEPHFLAPFVHWLPARARGFVARWSTPWGILERPDAAQAERMAAGIRLLRRREMRELFPDCVLLTERMFGFIPKSYIAVRGGVPDKDDLREGKHGRAMA